MGRFGSSLKKSVKRNNSAKAHAAKVEIRKRLLEWIGAARVFDAFAGYGELHRDAWSDAELYVGCDRLLYLDERTMFCADNRRVLRCIDLQQFNVFDLDAYGSPWEQALIIAARRSVKSGEKLAFALTVGEGLGLKLGGMPKALCEIAGFTGGLPAATRDGGEILDRAIKGLAERLGARLEHRWQATKKGQSNMRYLGLAMVVE